MAIRPTSNKTDTQLLKVFSEAHKELTMLFLDAVDQNNIPKRNFILSKIQALEKDLSLTYKDRAKLRITEEYLYGAEQIEAFLGREGLAKEIQNTAKLSLTEKAVAYQAMIQTHLWVVHTDAVRFLIEESTGMINNSLAGVPRNIRYALGEIGRIEIQEKLAKSIVKGTSSFQSKQDIISYYRKKWIPMFIDKGWRKRSLPRYADMLVRTEKARAHTAGVVNRGIENGITKYINRERPDCRPISRKRKNKVLVVGRDRFSPYHPNERGWVEPYSWN